MKPRRHPSLQEILQAQIENLTIGLRPKTLHSYRAAVNSFLRYLHAAYPQLRTLARLRRSLNPLSRFDFGQLAGLPSARDWHAKGRQP